MLFPAKVLAAAAAPENPACQGQRRFGVWHGAAGLALLLLVSTSCTLLRYPASQPTAQVKSLRPGAMQETNLVTLSVMEAQVMRFADVYASTVAQAADDFSAKVGTPEARLAALRWKLGQTTAMYIDATGPNPSLNALDMLVLVTLSRMVMEDHWVKVYGDDALPLLETHRRLEADAWSLANGALKPQQQQELKDLIAEWRQKNPDQRYIGTIRFKEFATALGRKPTPGSTGPTSIFSLLFLDPMAGLDPTTAAIEETRMMAERAMYYTQRMPTLLGWQTELLAYQIATQPESKQVLGDANRLSKSAEIFSATAERLPQLVNDQRQAAIQQLLDGLKTQTADMRETLNAGRETALAVNTAIKSLEEFVHYVSPTTTNSTAAATSGKPFDVLDYGAAASQVGGAASNLTALLTTLNQSSPQLVQISQQTTADAVRVVDHAFGEGLILIAVFLVGLVVAGVTYRMVANKLIGAGRQALRPNAQAP